MNNCWAVMMLRLFSIALLATFFVVSTAYASQSGLSEGESCNSDQPPDYYFVPKEKFAKKPFLIKTQRPGQVIEDRYSSNLARFDLRPINTKVAVPRNYLQSIHRNCARIAHQYWDLVFLEALWPEFSARTLKNEALFVEGASLDLIKVRVGSLSHETAHVNLQDEIKDGKLVETANHPSLGLKEYRDPKRKEPVFPSFYIADSDRIRTPNGNPLVIGCFSNWWEKVEDAVLCEVNFTLPHTLWSKEQQSLFGGVQGLEISYWFYKKNLASWMLIHQKILRMVDDMLLDIQIPPSNKSLNPDATHNVVLAEPITTLDTKTYHVALSMVKTLHLGDNLESMSYRVATASQTYLMVVNKVGNSTAQSLTKDELKRLQPKYQEQWDANLARSYAEFFDSNGLQSIASEKKSSKYIGKFSSKQNEVGRSMQSKSTKLLTDFVSEVMLNVFKKVNGLK